MKVRRTKIALMKMSQGRPLTRREQKAVDVLLAELRAILEWIADDVKPLGDEGLEGPIEGRQSA